MTEKCKCKLVSVFIPKHLIISLISKTRVVRNVSSRLYTVGILTFSCLRTWAAQFLSLQAFHTYVHQQLNREAQSSLQSKIEHFSFCTQTFTRDTEKEPISKYHKKHRCIQHYCSIHQSATPCMHK